MVQQEVEFHFANECDLEIHCLPFGLSGAYLRIPGTNIVGIGLTMGLITGTCNGMMHYNDKADLLDQKYKVFVATDEEGNLRMDFTKIVALELADSNDNVLVEEDVPRLVFTGTCPEKPEHMDPFIGIFSFERE